MNGLQFSQYRLLRAVLTQRPEPFPEAIGHADDTLRRLEIYRNGYRQRLREALRDKYPSLALMSGWRMDALLDQYIQSHTPSHYDIRQYGDDIATFIEQAHPWSTRSHYADCARLDWAIASAFCAADEPHATHEEFAATPAEDWHRLHLSPVANLQVIRMNSNADAFRRAADRQELKPRLRRQQRTRHVYVWREDMKVRYGIVSTLEDKLFDALMSGATIDSLCAALNGQRIGARKIIQCVADVISCWVRRQWLLPLDLSS